MVSRGRLSMGRRKGAGGLTVGWRIRGGVTCAFAAPLSGCGERSAMAARRQHSSSCGAAGRRPGRRQRPAPSRTTRGGGERDARRDPHRPKGFLAPFGSNGRDHPTPSPRARAALSLRPLGGDPEMRRSGVAARCGLAAGRLVAFRRIDRIRRLREVGSDGSRRRSAALGLKGNTVRSSQQAPNP